MGKEKDIAFVLAMALVYSTAAASTLCELDSTGYEYTTGSTLVEYSGNEVGPMPIEEIIDDYYYDAPGTPESVIKNVEITILSVKEGKPETPDYLFEDLEMYD